MVVHSAGACWPEEEAGAIHVTDLFACGVLGCVCSVVQGHGH